MLQENCKKVTRYHIFVPIPRTAPVSTTRLPITWYCCILLDYHTWYTLVRGTRYWVYVGIALYLVWAPSTYPYYIMLLCNGDDGDVQMKICRLYTARTDASPERHLTPSAPRPCHRHPTHQPSASPAKNCRRCPTQRAGAVERRPPGDRSIPHWERGGSVRTEGFTKHRIVGDLFHPGLPLH